MAQNGQNHNFVTSKRRQNHTFRKKKFCQKFRKKYSYGIGYMIFLHFEFTRVKTTKIANFYNFPIFLI